VIPITQARPVRRRAFGGLVLDQRDRARDGARLAGKDTPIQRVWTHVSSVLNK
jgi:hypothetical protein